MFVSSSQSAGYNVLTTSTGINMSPDPPPLEGGPNVDLDIDHASGMIILQ